MPLPRAKAATAERLTQSATQTMQSLLMTEIPPATVEENTDSFVTAAGGRARIAQMCAAK